MQFAQRIYFKCSSSIKNRPGESRLKYTNKQQQEEETMASAKWIQFFNSGKEVLKQESNKPMFTKMLLNSSRDSHGWEQQAVQGPHDKSKNKEIILFYIWDPEKAVWRKWSLTVIFSDKEIFSKDTKRKK